jgi:hypothetical protein
MSLTALSKKQKEALESKYQELQDFDKTKSSQESQLQRLNMMVTDLEAQRDRLVNQNEQLNSLYQIEFDQLNQKAVQEKNDIEKKLNQALHNNQCIKNEYNNAISAVKSKANTDILTLHDQIESLKAALEKETTSKASLESDNQQYSHEITRLKNFNLQESKRFQDQINQLKSQHEQEIGRFQEELNQSKSQHLQEVQRYQGEINQLKSQHQQIKDQVEQTCQKDLVKEREKSLSIIEQIKIKYE